MKTTTELIIAFLASDSSEIKHIMDSWINNDKLVVRHSLDGEPTTTEFYLLDYITFLFNKSI